MLFLNFVIFRMAIFAFAVLFAMATQLKGQNANDQTPTNATYDVDILCRPLDGTPFYEQCLRSAVVKLKNFVPRHLRPPWLKSTLFDDNEWSEESGGKNGQCYAYACYKGTKASNRMAPGEDYCACTYNGQVPNEKFGIVFGTFNRSRPICLQDLQKIAFMPRCGNKYYDYVKHCAMVHFYDNKPDKKPKVHSEKAERNAQKINILFNLFLNIFGILGLIDGCITGASRNCTAKVKIDYLEVDGQFNCRGAKIKVFEGTIQINKHEEKYGLSGASPFTFAVEFKNRICWNLMQSHTPKIFEYINLTLSGDCGKARFELPYLFTYKGRVQELRGIQLDLKKRDYTQWLNPFDNFRDYQFGKEELMVPEWQPTDLHMIDEYGHPKIQKNWSDY